MHGWSKYQPHSLQLHKNTDRQKILVDLVMNLSGINCTWTSFQHYHLNIVGEGGEGERQLERPQKRYSTSLAVRNAAFHRPFMKQSSKIDSNQNL